MTTAPDNLIALLDEKDFLTEEQVANLEDFKTVVEVPALLVEQIKKGIVNISHPDLKMVPFRSFHITFHTLAEAKQAPQRLVLLTQKKNQPAIVKAIVGFGVESEAILFAGRTRSHAYSKLQRMGWLSSGYYFRQECDAVPSLFGTTHPDPIKRLLGKEPPVGFKIA